MGKKKTRSTYTSNGNMPTVSRSITNAVRRERSESTKIINKIKAWSKGKRTMVTIDNPDKTQTNRKYIRVEGNHPSAFGPWKKSQEG